LNFTDRIPSILLIVDGLESGGGERVFIQLASMLKDRFRVSVASSPGRKFESNIKDIGVKFFPVDMSNRLSLKPIFQLKSIIQNHQIDIQHSQGARADFFARVAGRATGKLRTVCTIAMPVEGFDVSPLRKLIYEAIDRMTSRYVEQFIVVSDVLKKRIVKRRGIPADKIARIYNGIELNYYHPDIENGELRRELGISHDVPLIGSVGRMVWQKGFETFIRAIPEIISAAPESRFLFVGDGPLKTKLIRRSEQLGVRDKIVFAGFRSDIREILSAIDLFVVPSLLEGFPMVTLEAMAVAKPIIATQIDGITEQITDGKNGILVPPKNPGVLAEMVLKLIRNKELSRKLGATARQKVEQEFSVEKMVAETEKVYLSVMGIH